MKICNKLVKTVWSNAANQIYVQMFCVHGRTYMCVRALNIPL